MKVILTASAENNIIQIREFYRDIPDVGKRAIEAVKGGLFRLVDYPNIGKPNPEDDGVTRLYTDWLWWLRLPREVSVS